MVDLHCHILPGVDDGAPDLETSLEMAKVAAADGIDTIVATPHLLVDNPLSPAEIRTVTQTLNQALCEEEIDLVVLPGAEVEVQPGLAELLRDQQLVTLGDKGSHLLIEIPFVGIPQLLEQICFELQIAGVTPVIAHVERTQVAARQPEILPVLVERGCLLQVNVDSVLGHNGPRIRRVALELLRSGLAEILASDAHDSYHRPPELSPACKELQRAIMNINMDMLIEDVPRSIIAVSKEDDI